MLLRRFAVTGTCAVFLAFGSSAFLSSAFLDSAQSSPPSHVFFRVQAASSVGQPLSGRLLIFLKAGSGDKQISMSEFHAPGTAETFVCAREIRDLAPGSSVEVDADEIAYPRAFSEIAAGNYEVQAVLDVEHTYNYKERVPEDWVSPVVGVADWKPGVGAEPELVLDHHPDPNPQRAAMLAEAKESAKPDVARLEEFESPLLTRFWGRPTYIRAWVILPPGYADHGSVTYPSAYWTHGFGGSLDASLGSGLRIHDRMKDGKMPPMIWVMLDESCPAGTHEFADSVNNGPWGAALTTEFIPYLENKYRMDSKASSRLLNGHSSGGWATLQLEINYPKVFGGTWSTSPDPSDFHDFTGIDLYAPHANAYRKPDGTPYPIMRDKGRVLATFEELTRMEDVLGPYGGQVASFDWVFSPRSKSGAPEQMFDRTTGDVNPGVVAYWHDHYDLAHIAETHWAERKGDLKGRIHLYVGTADTFYLDGAAHKFDAALSRLGADAHFTYIPDRTHFDLYRVEKDPQGLFDEIGEQMWETARPGERWKRGTASSAASGLH
jgi:S-formylglutathione hydrolase FrmB